MINRNPETVSTDYDIRPALFRAADRRGRYRDRAGRAAAQQIARGHRAVRRATPSIGGLERAEVPILGTSPDAIDLAEDRERFQKLLRGIGLRQPENGTAYSPEQAEAIAQRIGYPVVIRPSYVLGGRAMEIVHDSEGLHRYIRRAVVVSGTSPC
jgi:carbamoyl-phosphate synthase large subunit